MSVTGVSSSSNYLLYLLQQQQAGGDASASTTASGTDSFSSLGLSFDNDSSVDDGTYGSALTDSNSQGSSDTTPSQSTNSAADAFLSELQSLLQSATAPGTSSTQTSSSATDPTSSASATAPAGGGHHSGGHHHIMSGLNSLLSDVQSGDMTSAQSAGSTLETDLQGLTAQSGSSSSGSNAGTSNSDTFTSFVSNLSDLLQATASGDTSTAQSAATKVESDLQTLGQTNATSGSSSTSSSSTDAAAQGSDTGNQVVQALLAAFANLQQAS